MAYIPLNKIITNLYTRGAEYKITASGVIYVGFYWEKYTGEKFTGKNPNSPSQQKLSPIGPNNDGALSPLNTWSPLYIDDVPHPIVSEYLDITEIDYTTQTKKLPIHHYPQPTEDDYSLGSFRRYFTVKQNQSIYLEINKSTFDSLKAQNTDWDWQPYLPFSIPWTLIGEEKVVNQTNEKIVLLQERRLKKLGLKEYLRFNYLKYYRPDSGEDLYTNGGDYLNERTGQEYVGYYHIHPIKGPMVGQFHVESDHDYLIPITGNTSGSLSNTPTSPSSPPSSGYSPSSGGGGGGY